MPDPNSNLKIYRRSLRASFFLVMFLVLVGGIVRSTGAGLGCPDWPKCFGLWVPPTDISQIPASYYSDPLASKNGTLTFNVVKTWTEYLNRLLGVVIGFSVFIQFAFSYFARVSKSAKWLSFSAFIMVGFQGWLGSKVVSSDLRPLVITIHLVVALLIALALLAALHFAKLKGHGIVNHNISRKGLSYWILAFLSVQFFLGTEVRGQVDVLFKAFDYGSRWLYAERLDYLFILHRSLSIIVFFLLVYQIFIFGKVLDISKLNVIFWPLIISILLIFTGIGLVYFNFPSLVQPFHLFFGFLIFCSQFWLVLHFFSTKELNYAGG